MADPVPSLDELRTLVIAAAWDEVFISDKTADAILTAVLPRVVGAAVEALRDVTEAKALAGVRDQVAGWNGENRPEGPYGERHPNRLGATLPKTNCGAVYALDEALVRARTVSDQLRALGGG